MSKCICAFLCVCVCVCEHVHANASTHKGDLIWYRYLRTFGSQRNSAVWRLCELMKELRISEPQFPHHFPRISSYWKRNTVKVNTKKVKVESLSRVRLFATPWTVCSPPGSSVHGILQARILEWVAISFSEITDMNAVKMQYEYYWHIVVPSLSHVQLFATPWTAASLSITISQSLLKLMSIKSVMPSNHLILCHPLFLLPSIFPRISVFSNESGLHIRWPKYWSFSFSISPSNEYSGLISLMCVYICECGSFLGRVVNVCTHDSEFMCAPSLTRVIH